MRTPSIIKKLSKAELVITYRIKETFEAQTPNGPPDPMSKLLSVKTKVQNSQTNSMLKLGTEDILRLLNWLTTPKNLALWRYNSIYASIQILEAFPSLKDTSVKVISNTVEALYQIYLSKMSKYSKPFDVPESEIDIIDKSLVPTEYNALPIFMYFYGAFQLTRTADWVLSSCISDVDYIDHETGITNPEIYNYFFPPLKPDSCTNQTQTTSKKDNYNSSDCSTNDLSNDDYKSAFEGEFVVKSTHNQSKTPKHPKDTKAPNLNISNSFLAELDYSPGIRYTDSYYLPRLNAAVNKLNHENINNPNLHGFKPANQGKTKQLQYASHQRNALQNPNNLSVHCSPLLPNISFNKFDTYNKKNDESLNFTTRPFSGMPLQKKKCGYPFRDGFSFNKHQKEPKYGMMRNEVWKSRDFNNYTIHHESSSSENNKNIHFSQRRDSAPEIEIGNLENCSRYEMEYSLKDIDRKCSPNSQKRENKRKLASICNSSESVFSTTCMYTASPCCGCFCFHDLSESRNKPNGFQKSFPNKKRNSLKLSVSSPCNSYPLKEENNSQEIPSLTAARLRF
ncbi:hypothetical protein BB560_003526 [Smittium megazygosporum]|uniref:Uncharacterized protein n=1 Tax=Smittium megazygosporum TaxID=133381 RepID=A0A2T9ZBU1_9FUNG|nr:hypothetical protein BB560_003526 [Smittium megazygosporum]